MASVLGLWGERNKLRPYGNLTIFSVGGRPQGSPAPKFYAVQNVELIR